MAADDRWLMIFDNLEKDTWLTKFIPSAKGRIVVTTRHNWLAFKIEGAKLEVDIFNPDESIEMFRELCEIYKPNIDRSSENGQIATLLAELNGHPLAIAQIAAYVSYTGTSMSSFLREYERASKRIHADEESSRADKSLATLWVLQFDKVHNTPAAAKILGFLSLLSPDTISKSIFHPKEVKGEAGKPQSDALTILKLDEKE